MNNILSFIGVATLLGFLVGCPNAGQGNQNPEEKRALAQDVCKQIVVIARAVNKTVNEEDLSQKEKACQKTLAAALSQGELQYLLRSFFPCNIPAVNSRSESALQKCRDGIIKNVSETSRTVLRDYVMGPMLKQQDEGSSDEYFSISDCSKLDNSEICKKQTNKTHTWSYSTGDNTCTVKKEVSSDDKTQVRSRFCRILLDDEANSGCARKKRELIHKRFCQGE